MPDPLSCFYRGRNLTSDSLELQEGTALLKKSINGRMYCLEGACFGKTPSGRCLASLTPIDHQELHNQGKGNELLLPQARKEGRGTNHIRSREKLGGLLKYYHRKVA